MPENYKKVKRLAVKMVYELFCRLTNLGGASGNKMHVKGSDILNDFAYKTNSNRRGAGIDYEIGVLMPDRYSANKCYVTLADLKKANIFVCRAKDGYYSMHQTLYDKLFEYCGDDPVNKFPWKWVSSVLAKGGV